MVSTNKNRVMGYRGTLHKQVYLLKKLERSSLSNASLEYRLQSRKLGHSQLNFNAVYKLVWQFANYGPRLSELICAVTAFGRSCASMLQRSPAHYWKIRMLYIAG